MASRIITDAQLAFWVMEDDDSTLGQVEVFLTKSDGSNKGGAFTSNTAGHPILGTSGQAIYPRKVNVTYQKSPGITTPTQGAMVVICSDVMERDASTENEIELMGGGGGGSGWHFGSQIEIAAASGFSAQTVVHLQPSNSLVTTGIRDMANPGGPLVQSKSGYWVSTKSVPAPSSYSGNSVWNLPQFPLPNPDNIDDPANYWVYLGDIYC